MVIARCRVAGNRLNSIGMVRNRRNPVTTYFKILSTTRRTSMICLVLRSLIFLMNNGLIFSLPDSAAFREMELNSLQSSQSSKASTAIIASATPNLMKKPQLDAASSILTAAYSAACFLAAGASLAATLGASSVFPTFFSCGSAAASAACGWIDSAAGVSTASTLGASVFSWAPMNDKRNKLITINI